MILSASWPTQQRWSDFLMRREAHESRIYWARFPISILTHRTKLLGEQCSRIVKFPPFIWLLVIKIGDKWPRILPSRGAVPTLTTSMALFAPCRVWWRNTRHGLTLCGWSAIGCLTSSRHPQRLG